MNFTEVEGVTEISYSCIHIVAQDIQLHQRAPKIISECPMCSQISLSASAAQILFYI